MKKVLMLLLILFTPHLLDARENSPVSVTEMVFCREVRERTPMDADTHFSNLVGRVFCHTRVSSTQSPTNISHVWYYNNVRIAIVDLTVSKNSWRTWSSKSIIREWTGPWRVDVISADGAVIRSEEFLITASPE